MTPTPVPNDVTACTQVDPSWTGTFHLEDIQNNGVHVQGSLIVTVSNASSLGFDWDANFDVLAVVLRGGQTNQLVYRYDPPARRGRVLSPADGQTSDALLCYRAAGVPTPTPTNTATATPIRTATPTLTATATPNPGSTGFRSPTVNSAANTGGDGDGFEVTPSNAYALDGLFAVDNNSGQSTEATCAAQNKDSHRFWGYGVSLPAGLTITGIHVRIDAKVDSTVGETAAGASAGDPMMCVQLSWNGGSSWTTPRSTGPLTTSSATYLLGGPADTWGRTWTPAQVSNGTLQVRIMNVSTVSTRDFFVDWVAVNVMYR